MAEGTPWAISKAFATSAPISKVVPIEKFDTPIPFFDLSLKVNGELRQQSSTKEMDHPVAELVEFIAGIFTLQPGDCIFTGTPEGVGEIKTGDTLFAELKGWTSVEVSVG
jgi:2-keto-4-pentenoate hydratase/2-oxohepta-3-ene-1,7-dioic acid hydratase in catechol pathway